MQNGNHGDRAVESTSLEARMPLLWIIVLLLVILAIGGGAAVSSLLWLLLIVALVVAIFAIMSGRRAV